MYPLVVEVEKELRRRLSDHWSFLYWVGIPLVIGTIVTLGIGGAEGPKPVAELLIDDRDESLASMLLHASFEQGGLKEVIKVDAVSPEAGEARIRSGDASALLIIPKGFGSAVLRNEPTELILKTNPAQTVLPSIVEEVLTVEVDAVCYVQHVFSDDVNEIVEMIDRIEPDASALEDGTVSEISVRINQMVNQIVEQVGPFLFPPAIAVEVVEEKEGQEIGFAFLFFPGVLLMAMLLIAEGLSGDIWCERERGTLKRMTATPHGLTFFLVGKVAAAAVVFLPIGAMLLCLGFMYHGISYSKLPLASCWLMLTGCLLYLLMILIQLSAPTRKSGGLLSNLVMLPLMMLGGSFFPFETMPEWMAAIGKWSPNGLMLEQLKQYLLDRHAASEMLFVTGIAVSCSVALLAIATAMTRRSVAK